MMTTVFPAFESSWETTLPENPAPTTSASISIRFPPQVFYTEPLVKLKKVISRHTSAIDYDRFAFIVVSQALLGKNKMDEIPSDRMLLLFLIHYNLERVGI
jgi:hypothetical protein